ncbi:MAG: AAA family ATPase, partial [Nitrospinae bacterium CG22_combo_CG10-13_8_21_14_all_47_10]
KPFTSYKVYNGNLFEQVDKAVAFVLDILKQAVIQQEHTPQFKRPFEIPIFAIQEAIVNALAHRNYNVTSGVQVMVFSDRLEIWNSGSLPPELGVEDLRKPHTSYPANPFLANALYFADYIQKMGSGTLEMIEQCRAQNAPDPEFVLIRNVEFRTILPRDMFTADALTNMGLNERQIKAVTYVKEKGRITNREYRQLNNISDEGARRDLSVLLEKKIFRTQGRGRSSSYIL